MKVIIAGSRNVNSYRDFEPFFILSKFNITEVVSGCAKGMDSNGERFAEAYGFKITKFPADWDKWGKAAGPKRNRQMAEYADALILIWDGQSKGSKNMLMEAKKRNLPIEEYIFTAIERKTPYGASYSGYDIKKIEH